MEARDLSISTPVPLLQHSSQPCSGAWPCLRAFVLAFPSLQDILAPDLLRIASFLLFRSQFSLLLQDAFHDQPV